MIILLFAITGLVTGLLAGLLGIGGGVITVPALYYIFTAFGFPQENVMHISIATALASTALTSIGSTWAQQKKRAIIPSILTLLVPGLIFGCVLGAFLTLYIPSAALRIIFGSMATLFAIYFFFPKLPPLNIAPHPNKTLTLFGMAFGCLSSLLGVGGGIFLVPTLLGYHVPMKNVVATSSAGTLATAFAGSLAYLVLAWNRASFPDTVGYIQIPAFLSIGICSFLTTSIGVHLAHTLHTSLIKRTFAVALAITGIAMLFGR